MNYNNYVEKISSSSPRHCWTPELSQALNPHAPNKWHSIIIVSLGYR